MNLSQLRLGRIKMYAINAFINAFSVRSAFILMTFVCIGFLFSCSPEVNGPEITFSGAGFEYDNSEFERENPSFEVEKTFETEFSVENYTRIILEAISGEVVVTGHGDANRVVVTAHQYVGSSSQDDAEMHIDDLEILASERADEILIKTVQPKHTDGRKYRVDYDIIVPSSFEVMTTQVNGSILIFDIANSVDVSNVNGNILLSNIVGGVAADVVNGTIDAAVVLPVNKTIDLVTDNGRIDLTIPMSTSAVFDASVVNGAIYKSNITLNDAVQTSKSLSGTLGNGEGVIDLWSVNGDISISGFD